jgi:hypothetical protein
MRTKKELLAHEVIELVDRFHGRRSHDAGRRRMRRVLRHAAPATIQAVALLSTLRGLRSRRRGLLPVAAAYLAQRKHRARRRKRG